MTAKLGAFVLGTDTLGYAFDWLETVENPVVKPEKKSHVIDATPEALVDALCVRCRELLGDWQCQDTLGNRSQVKVWAVRPPSILATDGDPDTLTTPSVIVGLVSGSGETGEREKTTGSVVITVGDRDEEQQGWRDAQQIARVILHSCVNHPILERSMMFTGEWEWQQGNVYDGIAQVGLWLTFKLGILREEVDPYSDFSIRRSGPGRTVPGDNDGRGW